MNLASLSKYKITVIGDLMIDEYWNGNVSRISPEAPVPVINIDKNEYRVGGAGNVAMNLRALELMLDWYHVSEKIKKAQ